MLHTQPINADTSRYGSTSACPGQSRGPINDGGWRAIAVALVVCLTAPARADRVPVLPSTPLDYVRYAVTDLPDYFKVAPLASRNNTPAGNPITNAGAALGRVLFYDEKLSHNDGVACASCHKQQHGFGDNRQKSVGFNGQQTARHSMALANVAYYDNGRMFWDERAATLEQQVLQPIQDPIEMGSSLTQLKAKLAATSYYPSLFQQAFGSPTITEDRIAKALAQFVRSMVSYGSKYDRAVELGSPASPNFTAAGFTAQELAGRNLFHTDGRCAGCHNTHAQVANETTNNGLDLTTIDPGAGGAEFKVPSLRNVEVRGAFMHDGRFTTLEQVIAFYANGVQQHPNLDNRLRAQDGAGNVLHPDFSTQERLALIAFLKTLTDQSFLTSQLFSDPFVDVLDGDFNGDGRVDLADLTAWKTTYGPTRHGADFLAWQRNVGRSLALPAAGQVPEPSAATLMIVAAIIAGGYRRGRRHTRVLAGESHAGANPEACAPAY